MNGEDFKVTTGQGAPTPPPIPQRPAVPPVPSVPVAPQPDFLSQEALAPSPIPEGVEDTGSGGGVLKTVILIVVALVVVGGVGALGYFVVFPLLFPADGGLPPTNVPSIGQLPHNSYLGLPPAAESIVILSDHSYATIAAALQNEAFSQLADGQLKEVKISDQNGQVRFSEYIGAVAPVSVSLDLRSWLEEDFTALLYYNPAGVWPVYIAKLKSGTDAQAVVAGFQSVESVMDAGNFYLTSPGTFSGFKDGKYKTYSTRYNVGAVLGASFNYGVFGDYLIISTNFDGLKATLPLLGL